MPDPGIETQLHALELELLKPEVRASGHSLDSLLAADFLEFGSSGRTYSKGALITALQQESAGSVSLSNFRVRLLAPGVALVTYTASRESVGDSLRSSVWILRDSRWQILFHQGTKIPSTSSPPED